MSAESARGILGYLESREAYMVDLLERFVCLESPSTVPETQEAMFSAIESQLERLHFEQTRMRGRSKPRVTGAS